MSWKISKIGDIAKINYGYTAKSSLGIKGPHYLRITDIQDGNVDWSKVPNCQISDVDLSKFLLKDGDIVFARTGATTGKSYLINDVPEAVFASYLIKATVNKSICLPKYVFYFFQSKEYWTAIQAGISGAAQGGFNASKLAELKIPLPNLSIQQKLVAKLDTIFAQIDIAMAAAEANAKNAETLFQSYLTEVFERGGEDWETKKLCEISSFDKNQGIHKGIPYIGMENIQSHTTQLINEVDQVEEVKSSTFKFNETHLLYGRLRPYLNKVYAPNFVGHCSTEIFPIKPFSNLLRDYLKYWLINAKTVDKINATCTGARMPRANMKTVMDFDFPLPPISIQKQLIEYFDSVQNCTNIAISSYKAKIVELTVLKHSVLQKAFNGELVKD